MTEPHPMFKDRCPEAAAWQAGLVLAWLAECSLATLEQLEERKSSSKADIARQRSICATAIFHCKDLGVPPRGLLGRDCLRLAAALSAPPNPPSKEMT